MQQVMYLEIVSVSMKSQCYEVPDRASVLVSCAAPGMNFSRQSKLIAHMDASTSKQWWMFKDVFKIPTTLKDHKLQIKLYGSSSSSSTTASAESPSDGANNSSPTSSSSPKKPLPDGVNRALPAGSPSSLEVCVGKLDVPLSSLQWSTATSFDLAPVSLTARDDKDKTTSVNILKRSVTATITLRLLSQPPPRPPLSAELDAVAVREKEELVDETDDEDRLLGTVRLVVWQGKNLNTEYPVFLDTRMNQTTVRRYTTIPVANPHNPIFDVIQDFDIVSLQGDLFVCVVTDHSLRANKPLGQVIIPLSLLTRHMVEYESSVSISGWFELFPPNKITKYNGGGKYVSHMSDIPLALGIDNCLGLPVPEKSLGFIKIDVTLQLYHSLLYTVLRNPFCVEEKPQVTSVDEDDTADLFDIYVTKHNFRRIMDTITDPLWFKTFKDIIRWNHHFSVTFFALFLYGYTCLLAPVNLLPVLFVVYVIFVGLVASYERKFSDKKLFVDEKAQVNKQQKVDEGTSKSLTERYKKMKQSVHKMEYKVREVASQVEKLNNLLLWSDPTLSITALFFLLLATLAASLMLAVIPFNLCFFFGGVVVFIPQEAMGRLKKVKRISQLLWQRVKAEGRIRYDQGMPAGAFLPLLRQSHLEGSMTGHIMSGELRSQTWSGSVTLADEQQPPQLNKSKWTRKWCELWAVPGVLKICDDSAEEKPPVLYDITYVSAAYIGKSSKRASAQPAHAANSRSSGDDIYLFEITYLKGKKAEALKQVVWPEYQTKGWVFACSSYGDAQTWIKAINKVTYRVSFWSIVSGEDFHNPFTKRVNHSVLSRIAKTLWRWVMLVPDNWELQHRYFCEQAYVRSNYQINASTLTGKPAEKLVNNDLDVIQVSSRKHAGGTAAMRFLSVGHGERDAEGGEGRVRDSDSEAHSSGIHVSLFRARGLHVKSSQPKSKGWLLASTIPKIYVNLSLSVKEECGLVLRTGGQPRSSEPVFREDFFFPDVDFESLLEKNASLELEVSVRTPIAFGLSSDDVKILGRIQIPLRPWIEQKLADNESSAAESGVDVGTGASGRDGAGVLDSKQSAGASSQDCLDDERWYDLISHTLIVGELQMQISCL